jgi:hypothetical protein
LYIVGIISSAHVSKQSGGGRERGIRDEEEELQTSIYIYVSHKGELELVEFVVQCTAPLETSLV